MKTKKIIEKINLTGEFCGNIQVLMFKLPIFHIAQTKIIFIVIVSSFRTKTNKKNSFGRFWAKYFNKKHLSPNEFLPFSMVKFSPASVWLLHMCVGFYFGEEGPQDCPISAHFAVNYNSVSLVGCVLSI